MQSSPLSIVYNILEILKKSQTTIFCAVCSATIGPIAGYIQQHIVKYLLCCGDCGYYFYRVPTFFKLALHFLMRMEVNHLQSYLFVLLLVSLFASCTSKCSPVQSHRYHQCAKLYLMLEAALLENPDNLYQLHDIFPSFSSEPIYARVSIFFNESSKGCLYGNRRECYYKWHHTCWTSSTLLRFVDPFVLRSLQLWLLNLLLLPSADASGQTVGGDVQLKLKGNFTDTDYNTTIDSILQDFTSWVSVDHLALV